MKIVFPGMIFALACSILIVRMDASPTPSPTPTPVAPPVPPEMIALHDQLAASLSPAARAWVADEADKAVKGAKITEGNIRADIQTRFTGQSLEEQDKNMMEFVVLTEAAQKMGSDLLAMFSDLLKKNAKDQNAKPGATVTLSPEDSTLLQTAMQRRTQFMATMLNLKKKISDTQSSVLKSLQ